MPSPLTAETIARAPKVLLHDHLDGGLRPQTVLELADEYGYRDLPADDAESLADAGSGRRADSGSLVQYLETFAHTVGVMQHPEAIHRVARECALDLAADGVVYAEVRFAPELSTAQGLAIEAVVEAMVDGFEVGGREAAEAGTPIRWGRCSAPCARPTAGTRSPGWWCATGTTASSASTWPARRSASRPTASRRPSACSTGRRAPHHPRRRGRRHREHPRGPRRRPRERLGHGVRIADEVADDGTLGPVAQRVRDEQVTLEIAPSSNVQTGAYPSLAEHPVDRLHRLGFAVTVNTDNRLMSGVSASSELADVAATFGWSWDDVQTVTERAAGGRVRGDAEKNRLLTEVVRPGYAALRA